MGDTCTDMPLHTDNSFIPGDALSSATTMDIVLDALKELVDYELAVVLGWDGKDTLRVHTAAGPLSSPRLAKFSLSLSGRPDLEALLRTDRPKLFSEGEDHVDTYDEVLDLPEGHSCLVSPLILHGRTIGLLTLDNRRCGVFEPSVVSFIGVVSRLIAVALAQGEAARALRTQNETLAEERNRLLGQDSDAFRDFAGTSPAWLEVIGLIKLVAAADTPVLLLGETGVGKEEAARVLHRLSPRSDGPFVALNCSALPASLAESELFGHEKGSFTGAQGLRKGRFELAAGGTLFLDEIGELPAEIQPKLLRALQEGCFERVGGERPVYTDVRIIAATHVDLTKAVAEGRFREDLFYRVSVFPVRIPSLRERGQDVLQLAELFLSRLRLRSGWSEAYFSPEALDGMLRREWTGNVRELKNAVERAVILARGGRIEAVHLQNSEWQPGRTREQTGSDQASSLSREPGPNREFFPLAAALESPRADPASSSGSEADSADRAQPAILPLKEVQRRYVEAVLAFCEGRIYGPQGAARFLEIKPTTLQSMMDRLGVDRKGRKQG